MTFYEWLTQNVRPEVLEARDEAMITLVFRFIAVFIVLWFIQLGMQLSAHLIRRSEQGSGDDTGPAQPETTAANDADPGEVDARTLAAIAVALELQSQPEAAVIPQARLPSPWAIAGRVRQQRHR